MIRIILFVFTSLAYSSTVKLSGAIYDQDSKPRAGVIISLGSLSDTTGTDGSWALAGEVGGVGVKGTSYTRTPGLRWDGRSLEINLVSSNSVKVDLINVRGQRTFLIPSQSLSMGAHTFTLPSSYQAQGLYWLRIQTGRNTQVRPWVAGTTLQQQYLSPADAATAARKASDTTVVDSTSLLLYKLQGQIISADHLPSLIQSGIAKWIQGHSVSGKVTADPRVSVDTVYAWIDQGSSNTARRIRLGYNSAAAAYSGNVYTVYSITGEVYNFRIWLNVTGNGRKRTGISDTLAFSTDFGAIDFIPTFSTGNAIPAGTIAGSEVGLVNTPLSYVYQASRRDIPVAHIEWDLGNGNGFKSGKNTVESKWLSPESYVVQARVTSIDSNTAILTKTVNISNQSARVLGIADTIITPNDVVVFKLIAHDTDGVSKVIWSFGDGGTDSTFTGDTNAVSHRFPGVATIPAGTSKVYLLTAMVVDKLGNKTQKTANITVSNDIPRVGVYDTLSEPDSTIRLHAASSDRGTIVHFEWSVNGSAFSSSREDTTITLPGAVTRKYPILVRVTDEDGNVSGIDSSNVEVTKLLRDKRDGHIYRTTTIGHQTWMAENLNWNPNSSSDSSWCLRDDETNCSKYGRLYNWASANAISQSYETSLFSNVSIRRGSCPEGWNLPDSTDFITLIKNVGGSDSAATTLRSMASTGSSGGVNSGGSDSYGFSVIPSGFRWAITYGVVFESASYGAHFWTRTEIDSVTSVAFRIDELKGIVYNNPFNKSWGYSVRCIKDL